LQPEIQITTQLFHLGAHLPIIIIGHIKAPAQAAVFFLKFLHATQQLLHQIARSRRSARRRAWRGSGAASAQRIKLAPQIQHLVLQRDALSAFHLRMRGRGKRKAKPQNGQAENGGCVRHADQAALP
jgi:hypothetical protein